MMKKIAFLGMGEMGSRMASHLHKAGYPLTIWNRSSAKLDAFVDTGIHIASTPAEAASDAEDIINTRVQDYMNWRKSQSAFSVIKLYRDDCEIIRQDSLNKSLNQLKLGKDPKKVVEQLSINLTSKLSHKPTLALNKAGQTENRKLINLLCDIFLINKKK